MNEQTTIRALTAVARDWGPLWSCVALFIIYQIAQHIHFRRKRSTYAKSDQAQDLEIEKLRTGRENILEDISELRIQHEKELADFRVELEKRTTYTWMEAKVLPRIDQLTATVAEFRTTVELLIKHGIGK